MGCASSAALPFLTNRENQGVAGSPRMNGNPPYELKMVNNKLKENGAAKDVNEAFVSEKMKEVMDSTPVQEIVGGVLQAKDEIADKVKGIGGAISENVTSVVDGIEDSLESAFGKLTDAVDSAEEKLKSEVTSIEENINSILSPRKEKMNEMKAEDIDELLESLPTEEEVTEAVETTAEEATEKAAEEVQEEDN